MGQQAFGRACLEEVMKRGNDEVVAVYCAPDLGNRPIDPIKEFALEQALPVVQPRNFKDKEVLDEMRSYNSDLCVMAYVTLFVPEAAREIPKQGSICFHPSLLPKHRGPSSINWAIISGATKTGLTIFWRSDGLDEGDILLQREVDIDQDDTLGIVYFQKIFPLGIEAVLESIDLVRGGRPPRIKQDESKATYESLCKHDDAKIDWTRPVKEVYNLIRGTNPQPGAWTTYNGEVLKIFDCSMSEVSGSPGEVKEISEDGITVGLKGGSLLVKRVKPENDKKINSYEYALKFELSCGEIFGK